MTSEPRPPARRFPIGLTLAAAIGIAILIALGVWQVQRLHWKEDLLARIAASHDASARLLGPVLARAAKGQDVEYERVAAFCDPKPTHTPMVFQYAVRDTQYAWRLITYCHHALPPYDGILIDRGVVTALNGAMAPTALTFDQPGAVTGVLRKVAPRSLLSPSSSSQAGGVVALKAMDRDALALVARQSGAGAPPAYFLAADAESPPPPGVTPAPLPVDIPNNHLSYAITWFGLAAALAGVYLAMLFRRPRS